MRIISKFYDVYDLRHSMDDPDRIWNRKSEDVLVRTNSKGSIYRDDSLGYNLYTSKNITRRGDLVVMPIFVAGEVHFIYAVYDEHPNVEPIWTTDAKKAQIACVKKRIRMSYHIGESDLTKAFASLVQKLEEQKQELEALFYQLRVPLAILSEVIKTVPDENSTQEVYCYKITTNPRLMDSNIPWQEIDSNLYRLHQSLEQYIWGVIGTGEPEILTVSDKDRLLAHGFDAKTSFRNVPR